MCYFPHMWKSQFEFTELTVSQQELMERGIYGLGGFLKVSKELRVLWSTPYLSRLWQLSAKLKIITLYNLQLHDIISLIIYRQSLTVSQCSQGSEVSHVGGLLESRFKGSQHPENTELYHVVPMFFLSAT